MAPSLRRQRRPPFYRYRLNWNVPAPTKYTAYSIPPTLSWRENVAPAGFPPSLDCPWRHWFASATMGQLRTVLHERLADTADIASAMRVVDAAAA